MNVDEAIFSPESNSTANADAPFSAGWWQSRSAEELRAMMNRGIGTGAPFDGATAEAERRARVLLRAEDQAAYKEAARKKRLRLVILEGSLLACMLALVAVLLIL
jgi:hypothetical protein